MARRNNNPVTNSTSQVYDQRSVTDQSGNSGIIGDGNSQYLDLSTWTQTNYRGGDTTTIDASSRTNSYRGGDTTTIDASSRTNSYRGGDTTTIDASSRTNSYRGGDTVNTTTTTTNNTSTSTGAGSINGSGNVLIGTDYGAIEMGSQTSRAAIDAVNRVAGMGFDLASLNIRQGSENTRLAADAISGAYSLIGEDRQRSNDLAGQFFKAFDSMGQLTRDAFQTAIGFGNKASEAAYTAINTNQRQAQDSTTGNRTVLLAGLAVVGLAAAVAFGRR